MTKKDFDKIQSEAHALAVAVAKEEARRDVAEIERLVFKELHFPDK